MPDIELGLGSRVWSYGSLDSFRTDFQQAQQEVQNNAQLEPLEEPKNEPPDTGLTRYLSSYGNTEAKMANLARINTFVEKFKIENNGVLPEEKESRGVESPDDLGRKVFGEDGKAEAVNTLTRLLEKKTLAAKRAVTGHENDTLSQQERATIAKNCATAMDKALRAAAMHETFANLRPGGLNDKAFADSRDALLNAALGIAEMIQTGQISEDAVVTLMNDGRLFDMTNTLDVTQMLKNAAEEAKEKFTQEKALNAELEAKYPDKTSPAYRDAKAAVDELVKARKEFTRVLDFEIHAHDPEQKLDDVKFQARQLQDVKLRLQQFRYDLQRCTNEVGKEFGHSKYSFYGVMEKIRRSASNRLGDNHVDQRFETNKARNAAFSKLSRAEKAYAEKISLQHLDLPSPGKGVLERAKSACETTHDANDGARLTQSVAKQNRAWAHYGHAVLGMLRESGGMRMVSTEISVSCTAGIGVSGLAEAKGSLSGFRKTSAVLACNKGGGFVLTLTTAYGARGEVKGDIVGGEGEADAKADVSHGHETKLTFTSEAELIAFCRQNAPKLLQSIPGALLMERGDAKTLAKEALPRLYTQAGAIVKMGKFVGSALGLRVHHSKNFNEVRYENRLQRDGVFRDLDGMLAERKNAHANTYTRQSVTGGTGEVKAALTKVATLDAKAELSVAHHAKKKSLETAEKAFALHTVDEMEAEVEAAEKRFDEFRLALPGTGELAKEMKNLKDLANARPAEGENKAKFWLGQTEKLRKSYQNLEAAFLQNPKTLKDKKQQVVFAEATRFYAVANEAVAKAAEKDGAPIAAKDARAVLGSRLARPGVALSNEVFYGRVMFGKEVSQGATTKVSATLEGDWDAGLPFTGRLAGKATGTFIAGKTKATQTDTLQFDLEVGFPLDLPAVYAAVERLIMTIAKKKSDDPDFKMKALDGLKEFGKDLGLSLAEEGLEMADKVLSKAAGKLASVPLAAAQKGINALLGLAGFGIEMPQMNEKQISGGKLSLKMENGTFTTFSYSDFVNNVKMLNVALKTPLASAGFSVGKKDISRQETVAFETLMKLPLPTLLARSGDLLGANGPSGPGKVEALLRTNQKAVNSLVKDLRRPTDPDKLEYKDSTMQGVRNDMERLKDISKMTTKPVALAKQADKLYQALFNDPNGVWTKIAKGDPTGESDEERVKLVADLAQKLLGAYRIIDAVS